MFDENSGGDAQNLTDHGGVELEVFGSLAVLASGKSDAELDALCDRLEAFVTDYIPPE